MAERSYVHEFIRASAIGEERGAFGMGMPKETATSYPAKEIEAHLNRRASEGWKLVSMEPNWYYEVKGVSGALSVTRPLAITGWYLTFERMASGEP